MKITKLKTKISTITFILLLTISAMLVVLPTATAQETTPTMATHAYLGATPNPIGINQEVLLHVGITQQLEHYQYSYTGLTVTVTDPDGVTSTLGPFTTDSTGGTGTIFIPTKIGTYTMQSHFPQQVYPETLGSIPKGTIMKASSSAIVELVVQQEPREYYPGNPLPSEYWTRPIDSQLREWSVISGSWLASWIPNMEYPYNDGPETAHILWAKPLTMGGLIGGDFGDHGMATGDAYEGKWATATRGSIIINGILYYNAFEATGGTDVEQKVIAIDLHTGEELWTRSLLNNAQLSFGQINYWDTLEYHGGIPYLWATSGSTWMAFDAFSGRWVYNMTGVPSGTNIYGPKGEILRYQVNLNSGTLSKWNSTAVYYLTLLNETGGDVYPSSRWRPQGRTFDASFGIEWTKTIPTDLPGRALTTLDDIVIGGSITNTEVNLWGLSLQPGHEGTLLYNTSWDAPASWAEGNLTVSLLAASVEDRVGVLWAKETAQYWGYNIDTGNLMWGPTEPQGYLNFLAGNLAQYIAAIAYGKFFATGYAGTVYSYDIKTGALLWDYDAVDEYTEILWGNNWPLYMGFVTDGKVYLVHTEHSVVDPKPRGAPFICLNATNGDEIWRVDGLFRSSHWGGRAIIGDSIIAMYNTYDQRVYAIGKGPSELTLSAPDNAAVGSTINLKGTVTDVSPGTQDAALKMRFPSGVPAISDEGMGDWMLYVYMQHSRPADAVGVPVKIQIVDPDGEYAWIGTATSDAYGNYGYSFIPQMKGTYTIIATFDGSKAYYGSQQTMYLTVDPAPAAYPSYPGYQGPSAQDVANNVVNSLPENPTSSQIAQAVVNAMPEYPEIPEQQEAPDYTNMFIILFVAVAIAIVIGLVSLFRKK